MKHKQKSKPLRNGALINDILAQAIEESKFGEYLKEK
jgi:hypothetical protein